MENLLELVKETKKQNIVSIGYSTRCKRVITHSVLLYENNQLYVLNSGLKIICHTVIGLYLDTPENIKQLKARL